MQNKFTKFYFKETHESVIGQLHGVDIYLNPSPEEVRSLMRNVYDGIKLGVTSDGDLYLWDAELLIHSDVQEEIVKNDFEVYLAWDKGKNLIFDEMKEAYSNRLYYKTIPKLRELFGNKVKIEKEFPNEAYYYGDEDEEPIRVKAREKSEKAPKIMFARWGGMNPTRNKDLEKKFTKSQEDGNPIVGFHHAPEHRGIYAFIWPYIDTFLAAWNKEYRQKTGKKDEYGEDEERMKSIKKFQHHGDIWCHFVKEAREAGVGKEYKGSWVKIDTKDLPMLLKKVMAQDIGSLQSDKWFREKPDKVRQIANPYKRGKGGFMSRDHLEVFIPGKVKETKGE